MSRTNDPIADYNRWDAEQSRRLPRLPECAICGEYIIQETAVRIDNAYICDECLNEAREPTI